MANFPSLLDHATLEYVNQARMNPAGEVELLVEGAQTGARVQHERSLLPARLKSRHQKPDAEV